MRARPAGVRSVREFSTSPSMETNLSFLATLLLCAARNVQELFGHRHISGGPRCLCGSSQQTKK